MSIDIKSITTETRNQNTIHIDEANTIDILKMINHEDYIIPKAIENCLPSIATLVDKVYHCISNGGRLIYVGCGTSGRIGILDAVECPPTFGVSYDLVKGIIAGGESAFIKAKEGAEDNEDSAKEDLINNNLTSKDFVLSLAASGRTPYCLGAVTYAKSIGCLTGCITTSKQSPLESLVDYPIVCLTGPEVISGSTRMKSGTAQKMICNMITTSVFIKLGKVYENYMIDVLPTNQKLISRSYHILEQILQIEENEAVQLLSKYHTIKKAVFSYMTGITNELIIDKYLEESNGNLKIALKKGMIK